MGYTYVQKAVGATKKLTLVFYAALIGQRIKIFPDRSYFSGAKL